MFSISFNKHFSITDEEWGTCTCTPTCDEIRQNITCQVSMVQDQDGKCCSCKDSMVRDDETGQCIPVESCPCVDENGLNALSFVCDL